MSTQTLTIGRLARAAGVGVETIRYYQGRGLVPVPETQGAYRYYPADLVERILFIKRAQALGFSLDEIAQLLLLEQGGKRSAIRKIASSRLEQVEAKLADLIRIQSVLKHLVSSCEHSAQAAPCPIIQALS